jgi:hypothetical protein
MDQKPFSRFLRAAFDHLAAAAVEQRSSLDQRETAEPRPVPLVFSLMRSHASLREHVPLYPSARSVTPPWIPRGDTEVRSQVEMDPLLRVLCQRISGWRQEVSRQPSASLAVTLQDALNTARTTGIDPLLWVVLVAMCERWFRIVIPTQHGIERELRHRLSRANYSPYRDDVRSIYGTQSVLARYVVQCLRERWDPAAPAAMAQSLRQALHGSIKALARELTGPILVVENRRLRRKRGTYPNWGPWVAAAALYADVRERFPRHQDARAWNVAKAVLNALHGRSPDNAEFGRKRRRIEQVAPWLMDRMVRDLSGR